MSKKKDARTWFPYYANWAEQLLQVPDDLRIKIDDAVKRYVLYGEEPQEREVLYSMFGLMRAQIDQDREKYEQTCGKRSENAHKRWNKATDANECNCIQKLQMDATDANKNKKENKNIISKEKDKKERASKCGAFVAPTREALCVFVEQNGLKGVNVDEFMDHYTANGWKVGGKSQMKDWKAAARNWNRRAETFGASTGQPAPIPQPRYKMFE